MDDNTNLYFKGQTKHEEVLCFTRKHWVLIVPYIVVFIILILCVALIFSYVGIPEAKSYLGGDTYIVIMTIGVFSITFLLHHIFIKIFNYYLKVFIITNTRVIELNKTLYFVDDRDTIDLSDIQDLSMQKEGIMHTILDYGQLRIIIASLSKEKLVKYIPNPDYYFRKIVKTKQAYMEKYIR